MSRLPECKAGDERSNFGGDAETAQMLMPNSGGGKAVDVAVQTTFHGLALTGGVVLVGHGGLRCLLRAGGNLAFYVRLDTCGGDAGPTTDLERLQFAGVEQFISFGGTNAYQFKCIGGFECERLHVSFLLQSWRPPAAAKESERKFLGDHRGLSASHLNALNSRGHIPDYKLELIGVACCFRNLSPWRLLVAQHPTDWMLGGL